MNNSSPPFVHRKIPFALRFKHLLPRSLFGRTLLIIVVPTLITLSAATYVFFDRHWYTVTNRLSYAVAGDVAVIVDLMQSSQNSASVVAVKELARQKMDLTLSFSPGDVLSDISHETHNPYEHILWHALNDRLSYPFDIDMRHNQEIIVLSPERRIYTPTTEVFIAWMTGSSILLSAIALLFMRNQIRPIRRLAEAAEAIGKGREVPWFKLEGAAEVRQAAAALMVMRDRLKRQITQRTAMLAGVSHDLRTPLTRMRLQLAMMAASQDKQELLDDIAEMEVMLEAYLAFARGEEAEPAMVVDLKELLEEIITSVRRHNENIQLNVPQGAMLTLRRNAMKRCLSNLIGNALRYGKSAVVNIAVRDHAIDIVIDDDGPGIDPSKREEVFRPFTRLEQSRNSTTGGVGLGLTIARDIARFHGGDVILESSPLGGLRARIWLPV